MPLGQRFSHKKLYNMPKIVQFLHTGVEAKPSQINNRVIPWNNHKDHRRKFILSKGKYVNEGNAEDADLTFWGEWEAQSNIERLNNTGKYLPTFLNRPFLDPRVPNRTHNTDPYVFGERFKYIICKQRFFHNLLTSLEPKSIILFGSCINKNFCLDTVFVVSNIQNNYNLNSIESLFPRNKRGQYYYASVNPIYDDTNYNQNIVEEDSCRISDQNDYTYYEAVNYSDKDNYDGIFSFVPCKLYHRQNPKDYTFKQPVLNLDFIKNKQTQGVNSKDCTDSEIEGYWKDIVSQVEKKGLEKGVCFKHPELKR